MNDKPKLSVSKQGSVQEACQPREARRLKRWEKNELLAVKVDALARRRATCRDCQSAPEKGDRLVSVCVERRFLENGMQLETYRMLCTPCRMRRTQFELF
jgi:hypothetical protein